MSARKTSIRLPSTHRLPVSRRTVRLEMVIYCLLISCIFTGLILHVEGDWLLRSAIPLVLRPDFVYAVGGCPMPGRPTNVVVSRLVSIILFHGCGDSRSQTIRRANWPLLLSPLENHRRNFSLLSVSISANKKHWH